MSDKDSKEVEINSFTPYNYGRYGSVGLEHKNRNLMFQSGYLYYSYLKDPVYYKHKLLRWSNILFNNNGFYFNVIDGAVKSPMTSRYIIPSRHKKIKQRNQNKENYIDFLSSIDDQYIAKNAMLENLRSAAYFGYLIYDKKNPYETSQLFELNPYYVSIVGKTGNRYEIGINVQDYINYTFGEGKSYNFGGLPEEIRKLIDKEKSNTIKNIKNGNKGKKEDKIVDVRSWHEYSRIVYLPIEKTVSILYGATNNDKWGQFSVLKATTQMLLDEKFQDRKNGAISQAGKTFVYQTYGEGNKGKGTTSMTDDQQNQQHTGVKNALNKMSGDGVAFASLFPNTKVNSIDVKDSFIDNESMDNFNRMGLYAGMSDAILTGKDVTDKALKILIDNFARKGYSILEDLAKELNAIFNNIAKNYSESKKVKLVYIDSSKINKPQTFKDALELFKIGGSFEYAIACMGELPEHYLRLVDSEVENNYATKYMPKISANNMSPDLYVAMLKGEDITKMDLNGDLNKNKEENPIDKEQIDSVEKQDELE